VSPDGSIDVYAVLQKQAHSGLDTRVDRDDQMIV
jgi:hypothetical protein